MSYGEPVAAPTGWRVFGWLSVMWLPLVALPSFMVGAFLLAFCDAPGSCQNADIYVPLVLFGGPAFWVVLLIALIRKRFPVVLRVMTIVADVVVMVPCLWIAWIILAHPA